MIFHYKPSSYWLLGYPHFWNPPIVLQCIIYIYIFPGTFDAPNVAVSCEGEGWLRSIPIMDDDKLHVNTQNMGVSMNGGSAKWMVTMENPLKMDDLVVTLFQETPILDSITPDDHHERQWRNKNIDLKSPASHCLK